MSMVLKLKKDDEKKVIESALEDRNAISTFLPDSTKLTLLLSLGGNMSIAAAKFYAYSRTGQCRRTHRLPSLPQRKTVAYVYFYM